MLGYTARTLLRTPQIREATLAELLKVVFIASCLSFIVIYPLQVICAECNSL